MSENNINSSYMIVPVDRNILSFDPCTIIKDEGLIRRILHLNTGLQNASRITPSRIINITRQVIQRDVFFLPTSHLSLLRIYRFRAHIEMSPPPFTGHTKTK